MSNNFTYAILADTNKRCVLKLTGELDANGETSNTKIIGQAIKGALANDSNNLVTVAMGGTPRSNYRYTIGRIVYDVNLPGYLKLSWDGANPSTIATLSGPGDLNIMDNLGAMNNTANVPNGNVTITTIGATTSSSYTLIIELYKNPADYDQGQTSIRKQDFNIPGVTPYNSANIKA